MSCIWTARIPISYIRPTTNRMPVSRTKRTIQNSKVSLILFIIQLLVGFYSRKVFLDCLGDEVIGLNTTLGNILSFLNLAELGIGIAMATSLYKPLHDDDKDAIVEIITVQGILYRRVAWFLCGLSIPILISLRNLNPHHTSTMDGGEMERNGIIPIRLRLMISVRMHRMVLERHPGLKHMWNVN